VRALGTPDEDAVHLERLVCTAAKFGMYSELRKRIRDEVAARVGCNAVAFSRSLSLQRSEERADSRKGCANDGAWGKGRGGVHKRYSSRVKEHQSCFLSCICRSIIIIAVYHLSLSARERVCSRLSARGNAELPFR
jgi:hypothetical protein